MDAECWELDALALPSCDFVILRSSLLSDRLGLAEQPAELVCLRDVDAAEAVAIRRQLAAAPASALCSAHPCQQQPKSKACRMN